MIKKISIRFGFFVRDLHHRSPHPIGDFQNPSGTPPCPRAYGPRARRGPRGFQNPLGLREIWAKIPSKKPESPIHIPSENPNIYYIFSA